MRLGLYGGTFDPIHCAHITVAQTARRQFALDRVFLIPNRLPPHKDRATSASYDHRLRMVEIACRNQFGLAASDIENHEGKSYTIQTLERLRTQYGESVRLYFIIGADAFAEVVLWHRVEEVFRMTEFIVVSRPGFEFEAPRGAIVHRLESLALRASSTEIRRQLAAGEAATDLDPEVREYIGANGLYGRDHAAS
jgi:nicotinate-nucleotide adenylyltransferase